MKLEGVMIVTTVITIEVQKDVSIQALGILEDNLEQAMNDTAVEFRDLGYILGPHSIEQTLEK